MSWAWFHKLASPKWFYHWSKRWSLPVFFFGLTLMLVGMVWGLAFAPADYQQGEIYRIMYLHVPAAILGESCYLSLGVAGFVFLVWKMKMAPVFIRSMAPIGAVMAAIALISGSIWGKPTWGAWWVWDARLTSVLVLFLLYMGVMAIQNTLDDLQLANQAAAVICVLGLINLPIIKYSVVWWNTLHQKASFSLTQKPAMPMEMWLPLLIATLGFYCFVAGLVMWRMRAEILYQERGTAWVKEEVLNDGV